VTHTGLTFLTTFLTNKHSTMKKRKMVILAGIAVAAIAGGIAFAADHIDAPAVTNQPSDITDLYAFRAAETNNLVLVANTQGLLSPTASASAKFDANTLIEFNIDNNNDNQEDLVIQAIYDPGSKKMNFYGPVAPSIKGTRSKLEGGVRASVDVTPYGASAPIVGSGTGGIKVFAGPRDDPFFFDLNQFRAILAGTATSFNAMGSDAFAGTNVMSVVVEIPKSLLGGSGTINVWLETKKKV
jgi:hypothetical protein